MTVFTEAELNYLRTQRLLGRLATVGPDGMPHIAPVGWRLDPDAPEPQIQIHPTRIVSWGLDGGHTARTIRPTPTPART